MNIFVEDIKKYGYQFLEFDKEKNDFKANFIDLEKNEKSKIFNKVSPIIKNFNLLEKEQMLEINDLKLKCNESFLGKKYNRDKILDDIEEEILNFFQNDKKLYDLFLEYCKLKDEEVIIIINNNSDYKQYLIDNPYFLVTKVDDNYIIIHRRIPKNYIEIYSINLKSIIEVDFSKIVNHNKFYVFQIVNKKDLLDFKEYNIIISSKNKKNKKK